jgi:hypothetical protein
LLDPEPGLCSSRAVSGHPLQGGTSLSKAYGAIHRFSEDIDLSLDRHDLGYVGERDPERAASRKAGERLLSELRDSCGQYLADEFVPSTVRDFETFLGPVGTSWTFDPDPDDPQTILFSYPPSLSAKLGGYVRPIVRLEFGYAPAIGSGSLLLSEGEPEAW